MSLPVFAELPMLRWSPDAAMRFTRHSLPCASAPKGLEDLLAMIASTRCVERPLLRALRALNPLQPRNAGLEAAAWNHPDVLSDCVCMVRQKAAQTHLQHFRDKLPPLLKERVLKLREEFHSHFRAGLNHEENLWFNAHADETIKKLPDLQELVKKATGYASKMLGSIKRGDADKWEQLAYQWIWRADDAMAQSQPELFQTLCKTWYDLEIARGQTPVIPVWADPVLLHGSGNSALKFHAYWLVQDAGANALVLQAQPAHARQSFIAGPVNLESLDVKTETDQARIPLYPRCEPATLIDLASETAGQVEIRTGSDILIIDKIDRPMWSESWGRDRMGLFASLAINGQTQTFRYLAPGHFLMGSPATESQRYEDEGPQHLVTLTEGLWLADTACTQGLWQAVMGNNPSHFKPDLSLPAASLSNPSNGGDADLPVEQVSWDDVREFLKKLQVGLPEGVEAVLPTEAEWEYACRAATTTPFSFGENISTEQVNYHGNFPYAGGAKGQYREKTVGVKALPANPWGLYQMHGNVWEWCADAKRDYTTESVTDPSGAKEGGSFAVRGGSWFGDAQLARSALRFQRQRDFRNLSLGFRFALRSRESGVIQAVPLPEGEGKAAEAASGRGGTPRPENSIPGSVKELLTGRGRKK